MATKKAAKKAPRKTGSAPSKDSSPSLASFETAVELKKSDVPYLEPPNMEAIGVWNNSKKIVQTWGKAQDKNAWLNVSTLGWRRIRENSESAMEAMILIGAHARDKGSVVNVRTEADNKIYELYVW